MDFISHGLWGGIAFGRKNKKDFWWSFSIGIAPDVLSFGIFFAMTILGIIERPNFGVGPHNPDSFPSIIYTLYNITHSLVTFGVVFLVLWFILKKPFLPLWAWGFHVVLDIFTHSFEFFPTPFLWPLSDYKLDAWMWGNWWIFIPNLILLIVLYSWFFTVKLKKRNRQVEGL